MSHENIKKLILAIGFLPEEGKENTYTKQYKNHSNYTISLDFNSENINYGEKITIGDRTTSNFSSSENFVVLECVDKLLVKGYSPEKLTLEIKWDLGRKEKGKLDIFVADKDDSSKCFLMIECKTYGSEYDKEKKNMFSKGGQLFSYFQQDKSAQYLCLYASQYNNGNVEYDNSIVEITEEIRSASNKNESYSAWNKSFKDNGVFEDWVDVYDVKSKALVREKLKTLKQSDSGFIFNRFAEILRHNVVSDKPNAFNKMFNLFLCKIEDENREPDEELAFQWKEDDTHISLQNRLNNLYKEGMRKFLNIDVADFSDTDLDKELMNLNSSSKKHIADMFMKLRLYKNNEFAFKEVFDDASFEENATVIKEVVELLQPFQLRYSHKQQFLGDFFELLLNTGLKQESGQFFTPVPIAKFITSSIPLKEIIENKLANREENFLPYVIDYAAGSGHFLTEAMDEIQHIIEGMDKSKFKDSVSRKLKSYSEDTYAWANEFIYGIEKDYRLVKTAKVACFLNGDGLANLIHADGLDSFETSKDYEKLLKKTNEADKQNNHQFDVIVANPPYSVSAFKNTLKNGEPSFNLFKRLTDDSSEIECLFIERTKQLMKEGAYAGIILPSSILSNSGIYTDTREIILKYFDIIGIAELGSNTFMATGTNTVTLFLRKRDENHWIRIKEIIDRFMLNPVNQTDMTCNGIENAFSKYCQNVYEDVSFSDYKGLLGNIILEDIESTEMFKDYKILFEKSFEYKNLLNQKWFKESSETEKKQITNNKLVQFIKEKEEEKLLHFMLSYNKQVVLIKSGEKQGEKDFLGYEFSNRRGHEGMRMYLDKKNKPTTKLYDMENLLNPEKVNSYIHRAFLGETISDKDIDESLKKHVYIKNLQEMISFDKIDFSMEISLVDKKKVEISSKYNIKKISELCEIGRGRVINKEYIESHKGEFPVYSSQTQDNGVFGRIDTFDFDGEYVTWTTDGIYAGTCSYRTGKFNCTNVCGTLKALSKDINMKYLSYVLNLYTPDYVIKKANPKLMNNVIANIKIPIPPIEIQREIIEEFEKLENNKEIILSKIDEKQQLIDKLFEDVEGKKISISELCETTSGGTPLTTKQEYYNGGDIPWLKSGEVRTGKIYKAESFITQEGLQNSSAKYIPENSVLIAMYGATAGQIGLLKFKATTNQAVCALLPNNKYLPEYLFNYLKDKTEELLNLTIGTAQKNLSQTIIGNYKVPVPSIEIQKEIVEKINVIESNIELLKDNLNKVKEQELNVIKSYL